MNAKTDTTEEIVRILIVDDSPTQVEHLKYILEQHSYSVTVANSGRQALAHIGKKIPTLVITDIVMPEMNGYEFCQAIKAEEKTKGIPVILLTSLSSTEDVLEGLACGADNFISKPYSEQYLLSNIANILVNAKLRKSEYVRLGMEIQFGGKKRFITADQQQMLSMLISTYEAAVNRNKELIQSQNELRAMNERLEELVDERTAKLTAEIAERKKTENNLQNSEELFRNLFQRHAAVKLIIDPDTGEIMDANEAAVNYYGWSREQITHMKIQDINISREDEVKEAMKKARANKKIGFEFHHRRADGSVRDVEVFSSSIKAQGKEVLHSIVHDITDRKKAEELLKQSEAKYRLLADNVHDVIFVLDMNLNYTYVSPSVKILRGYEPEEVMQRSLVDTLVPSSMELAIKTLADFMELEKIKRGEITKSHAISLEMRRKDESTVWTEVMLSFIRDKNQQAAGILGVTRDITERRKAEMELLLTIENLRKSFSTTVYVMVSAVEMRDPYTAGHQLRVADLASAIATERGLSQEKIDGIRMAGSIHDIGKLSIPAEILSKPTKLTNLEFSLIKEHAQSGYEMLKNVESPWPLAQIVYQHHERMDGSGYPRNLKGDEIIMEARIMAVADVVEAMASHRPYRAALGIESALEEIEKNKGILYDDAVADACLKLFREKGYQLT